jgi:hypothetical protein
MTGVFRSCYGRPPGQSVGEEYPPLALIDTFFGQTAQPIDKWHPASVNGCLSSQRLFNFRPVSPGEFELVPVLQIHDVIPVEVRLDLSDRCDTDDT